jgi:hypothetical protein
MKEEENINDAALPTEEGEAWEPRVIHVTTSIGTVVNLMDYLWGGAVEERLILSSAAAEEDIDPMQPAARRPIIKALRAACAEAGFHILCQGWDRRKMRLQFTCARGTVYRSQHKNGVDGKMRQSSTTKPLTESEKCPFAFAVHWFKDDRYWGIKSGHGCRRHQGHGPLPREELARKRTLDFHTAMFPTFQELAQMAEAADARIDRMIRNDLNALLQKYQEMASPPPPAQNPPPRK